MVNEPDEKADRLAIFLSAGVVIGDPSSLPGLADRIEREAVPKEGTPFNTQRTTGEKVDCALCGRQRNNFRGFVVTFVDGRRAIIGRDCGEKQLFDKGAWAEMAASAERRKVAALYAVRSAPTIAAIDKLLPVLDRCEDEVAFIGDFLRHVSDRLPGLGTALAAAASRDGTLSRPVESLITVAGHDGKEHQVTRSSTKVFAKLSTIAPFAPRGLAGLIAKIRRGLERAHSILGQEDVTLAQQGEAFQMLRTLRRDLRDAQAEAEKARHLLLPTFWENVAKWGRADPQRKGNYRLVRGEIIRHSDADFVFGELSLPDSRKYQLFSFGIALDMWPKL